MCGIGATLNAIGTPQWRRRVASMSTSGDGLCQSFTEERGACESIHESVIGFLVANSNTTADSGVCKELTEEYCNFYKETRPLIIVITLLG